jgi:hypothetical protein
MSRKRPFPFADDYEDYDTPHTITFKHPLLNPVLKISAMVSQYVICTVERLDKASSYIAQKVRETPVAHSTKLTLTSNGKESGTDGMAKTSTSPKSKIS